MVKDRRFDPRPSRAAIRLGRQRHAEQLGALAGVAEQPGCTSRTPQPVRTGWSSASWSSTCAAGRHDLAGNAVPLTRIEFDLVAYLAAHPGWVVSPDQLMEEIWGYRSMGDTRAVAVHIGNVRRKLGDRSDEPRYIQTVRGAGYKLVNPEAAAPTSRTDRRRGGGAVASRKDPPPLPHDDATPASPRKPRPRRPSPPTPSTKPVSATSSVESTR